MSLYMALRSDEGEMAVVKQSAVIVGWLSTVFFYWVSRLF